MDLNPNLDLMYLVFFIFILLVVLLNRWLYTPMLDFLAKRANLVDDENLETLRYRDEIQAIRNEAQQILQDAKNQAKTMIDNAEKESSANYVEKFENAKNKIKVHFETLEKECDDEMKVLRQELHGKMQEIVGALDQKFEIAGDSK
ncbi:hypothetical protein BBW65_06425 [Helicobacter enhydrae]|uniref:ATP synthase subunit b n=1 Tax=Helicobacter enhydrae TaxID=222136 RepID=A0A1B1U6Y6_9HELI|nr:hypothetical protein [Helicobacter enhydrae]ANV98452.1 hypothetical protein BBW65_06425 [Helicobacter enhydrae]